MFKLLWAAIVGGNPASWGIMALGAVIYSGGVFGAGYVSATHSALKIESAAPVKAAKAQQNADVKMHNGAVKASDVAKKDDDAQKQTVAAILAAIKKAEPKPQTACDLPADVSQLLNQAGQPIPVH